MIGYKVAKAGHIRVIVTLEIPDDALRNTNRTDIVNSDTAKYRTNKANVLKIEDQSGKEYTEADSFCYAYDTLTYTVNKEVVVEDYDTNIDAVCGPGIHFFLSRRVAELYNVFQVKNGLYQEWYENGQKLIESTYVNGEREGPYQEWYKNGQKALECTFVDGKKEGLYQTWYENGQKLIESTYVNGEREGLYQTWYDNGRKLRECMYVNGQREGPYQEWLPDGTVFIDSMYVNWKIQENGFNEPK